MGVPKFYRWISERYPCLSEVVREYQIPEFDNLYLDMNGIIHLCSHPNDEDPHFRITEEKIFTDIFHYIEILFKMIKPRDVFYMAVDGVAPRAKMNQQRGRRFRSAREAEELEKKAIDKGEILPKEERFDSNCITPGTVFMAKLHEQLQYFVTMKISTDPTWQNIKVYLSGHETPGEGEHKIMEFIRHEKSKPDYNPNTRHCLYGLDADLIMLGLCTHEPHFSLLREEVRFCSKKNQKRYTSPEETTFHLLHLSLMREYLDYEFKSMKDILSFPYDLEKLIDDWVLMGFLVGNDFIPNLPHMHIAHDALPMLYKTYIEVLPTLDGYINEGGFLNLIRFEKYLERVSEIDYEKFNDSYADLKWLESKGEKCNTASFKSHNVKNYTKGKKINGQKKMKYAKNVFDVLASVNADEFPDGSDEDLPVYLDNDGDNIPHIDDSSEDEEDEEILEDEDDDKDTEEDMFEMEFRQHKRDYYMNKLDYANVTSDVLKDQTECYIRAIQWNLHYYYNGVCSWSWYYPHHYAPFISDVKGFNEQKMNFELGRPFLPFEQLLAVLPAASKKLLPSPYQNLMSDKDSALIDFYPVDFKTDMNGKQQEWEAVVLIPFINEERLLEAMKPLENELTTDEKLRNRHGPCYKYSYTKLSQGFYPSPMPGILPDVLFDHAECQDLTRDDFYVLPSRLKKGICENVSLDVYYLGFPTLKHIPHTSMLKKAEVRVFQQPTRKESMILKINTNNNAEYKLNELAKELIGQSVYVGWPHLTEAKVLAVSDANLKYSLVEDSNKNTQEIEIVEEKLSNRESDLWYQKREGIIQHYYGRFGIEIEEVKVLLYATTFIGRRYFCTANGKVVLEKQWTTRPTSFALETVVKDITIHDSPVKQIKGIEELFTPKTMCFMLGFPNYGCMGEVVDIVNKRRRRVTVNLTVLVEPDIDAALKKQHGVSLHYMKSYTVAQKLGISSYLLSRITGTFIVTLGSESNPSAHKVNIGLNLKFNKKNKEVPGYTKKTDDGWLYSTKAMDAMSEYLKKFPDMFDSVAYLVNSNVIYADDIFPDAESHEKLQEIQEWLQSQPFSKVQHQQCGTDTIDEPVVKLVEEIVDQLKETNKEIKTVKMQVRRNNVFLPSQVLGSVIPDPSATYKLFDRVVVVREDYSVPIGFRGTITGIHLGEKELDTLYDIVFDQEFIGGFALRCSPNRGYRLPCFALINLSHGIRQEHFRNKPNQKPTAVVHPQATCTNSAPQPENILGNNNKLQSFTQGGRTVPSRCFTRNNSGLHSGTSSGLQVTKLNHSPSSPFVPRQVMMKTKIGNVSEFNSAYQSQPSQFDGRKRMVNKPGDNEFLSFWKELQDVKPQMPQKITELDNAAKILQSQSLAPKTSAHHGKKGIKNTDSQSPKKQSFPSPKSKTNSTSQSPSMEFKNLLRDLAETSQGDKQKEGGNSCRKEKEKYDASGTATLLQLLNINNDGLHNKDLTTCSKSEDSKKGVQTHNSQLSVAKLEEQACSNVQKHVQSNNFPGNQQFKNRSSAATWNLLQLVQNVYSGSVPLYTYMNSGPNQLKLARLKLPDGTCHCGQPCLTLEEAGESAAIVALNYLKERLDFSEWTSNLPAQPWSPNYPLRPQLPPAFPASQPFPGAKASNILRHPLPPSWMQQPSVGNMWWNSVPMSCYSDAVHPSPQVYEAMTSKNEHGQRYEAGYFFDEFAASSRQACDFGNTLNSAVKLSHSHVDSNIQKSSNPFIPMQVTKQNVAQKRSQELVEMENSKESSTLAYPANVQQREITCDSLSKNTMGAVNKKVSPNHGKRKNRLAIKFPVN